MLRDNNQGSYTKKPLLFIHNIVNAFFFTVKGQDVALSANYFLLPWLPFA